MEILALMFIVYFLIGASVCLLICVNPNDPGILGRLNRLVFSKLPKVVGSFVKKVFGQRIYNVFGSVKHYLIQTNHPLVQIFYLLIAVGGFIAYEFKGILKHMPSTHIGEFHMFFANVLAFTCFYVYYKACAVGPGRVTKENLQYNVKKYQNYYDDMHYTANKKCQTCQLVKPARSKHCSTCGYCVITFDHHCIWYTAPYFRIRQCVGQKNYKWFVLFLGLHAIFCLYLSVIGAIAIYDFIVTNRLFEITYRIGNHVIPSSPMIVFQYMFLNDTTFIFLIFMCAIMGVALFIFVLYHLYLISKGTTTRERIKNNDYIAQLQHQIKNKRSYIQKVGEANLPQSITIGNKTVDKKTFLEFLKQDQRELGILMKGLPRKGLKEQLRIVFSQ